MAQRAGSHISQVNASHVSLISHPDTVVGLVEDSEPNRPLSHRLSTESDPAVVPPQGATAVDI